MKAVIENIEPVIRPATIEIASAKVPRQRRMEFVPFQAEATLFHAWRA